MSRRRTARRWALAAATAPLHAAKKQFLRKKNPPDSTSFATVAYHLASLANDSYYHNPEVCCSISFVLFALIGSIVKTDMYLWKPFSFHTTLYAFHHPSTSTATMTTVWFEWSLWCQFSAQKFDALQLLVKRVGDFWWLLWLPTSSDYHGLVLHSLEVILTHVIVSVDGLGCEMRIK